MRRWTRLRKWTTPKGIQKPIETVSLSVRGTEEPNGVRARASVHPVATVVSRGRCHQRDEERPNAWPSGCFWNDSWHHSTHPSTPSNPPHTAPPTAHCNNSPTILLGQHSLGLCWCNESYRFRDGLQSGGLLLLRWLLVPMFVVGVVQRPRSANSVCGCGSMTKGVRIGWRRRNQESFAWFCV